MTHVAKMARLVCMVLCLAIAPPHPPRAVAQDPSTLYDTYTSLDNRLSFDYPAAYFVDIHDELIVIMANPIVMFTNELAPGDFKMTLIRPEILNGYLRDTGQDHASYFEGLIEVFQLRRNARNQTAITIGPYPALTVDISGRDSEGQLILFDTPSGYLAFMLEAYPGEAYIQQRVFTTMAESIRLSAPHPQARAPGAVIWSVVAAQTAASTRGVRQIYGLAVDPTESLVYVAESRGILVLDVFDGHEVALLPLPKSQGQVARLSGIAVAEDGTLWVSDNANMRLYHLDTRGGLLRVVGTYSETGQVVELGMFDDDGPEQVAITASGDVMVFNRGRNDPHRLLTFDAAGDFVSEITLPKPARLHDYDRYALGPAGNIYVSVSARGSTTEMIVLTPTGTLVESIVVDASRAPHRYGPVGALVVRADGTFWATTTTGGMVFHFDTAGTVIETFGKELGLFRDPAAANVPGVFGSHPDYDLRGLAVLADGDLIIGDSSPQFSQIIRVGYGAPEPMARRLPSAP